MSRAPFVMPTAESAFSRNNAFHDTMIGWRFVNALMKAQFGVDSMPETAENIATDYRIEREAQVPYAERIDQKKRKSIPEVTEALGAAARSLSARIGGMVSTAGFDPVERESVLKRSLRSDGR